jgi:hypothetical protein
LNCAFTFCGFTQKRANSWEIPLLLRLCVWEGSVTPFAGGGYTYRRIAEGRDDALLFRTGPVFPGEEVDLTPRQVNGRQPGENTHGVTGERRH